ncbi:hypothetical protein CBL_13090 [Carabus blaptoides fortunei]
MKIVDQNFQLAFNSVWRHNLLGEVRTPQPTRQSALVNTWTCVKLDNTLNAKLNVALRQRLSHPVKGFINSITKSRVAGNSLVIGSRINKLQMPSGEWCGTTSTGFNTN